jgi:DtxR family Mn-dependent transcriptional regulator
VFSTAEENYLKGIYKLQQGQNSVSTNQLAELLQTKPASVTDMLKRLQEKGMLQYERYYGVKLSRKGRTVALAIVRRHRLWEFFLVNHLKFRWEEVHDIAEQLEHVQSVDLTEKLDAYLGFPRFDPHGDPIPDSEGGIPLRSQKRLSDLEAGASGVICGVADQSKDLLEMLTQLRLHIGTAITVRQRHNYDHSAQVQLPDGEVLQVSEMLCRQIYINPQTS